MRNRMFRFSLHVLSIAIISTPVFATNSQSQKMPWPEITVPTSTKTGSTKEAKDLAVQAGTASANGFFNRVFNATGRPAWLSRTDFTYSVQQTSVPVTGIETIQPLYQDLKSTLFWQGRYAYNTGSTTLNLGLGYRFLRDRKDLMLGINTFFDENVRFMHKRLGIGAEVFTPYVTFRANYYDALTSRLYVGNDTYERALNGCDASIETPVPYFSWMRFTAQGYHYEGVAASNTNGGLANLRIFPGRQLEIDAGLADDNKDHVQAYLTLNYYFSSPVFIEYSATTPHPTSERYTAQNLEDMRLQKVRRNNNIVVEKTIGTAVSTAIIISRGT